MYSFIFIFVLILYFLTSTSAREYKLHESDFSDSREGTSQKTLVIVSKLHNAQRDGLIHHIANCLEKYGEGSDKIIECFAKQPASNSQDSPDNKVYIYNLKQFHKPGFFRDNKDILPYKPKDSWDDEDRSVIFVPPKSRRFDLDFIKYKILRNLPSSSERSSFSDEPNNIGESYYNSNKKLKNDYSSAISSEDEPRETPKLKKKKKKNKYNKRQSNKHSKKKKSKKPKKIIESTVEESNEEIDNYHKIKTKPTSDYRYAYMQGPSRIMNARKRLPYFLPKRYHWSEEEITKLKNYWIDGPQGKYWGQYKTPY